MIQDQVFLEREGDQWFKRNKATLDHKDQFDWPCYLIDFLDTQDVKNVIELGCSNGWRLERLRQHRKFEKARFVGIDASFEAIQDGHARYPELELYQGLLNKIPLQEEFDVVIIYFVLHWVDRSTLARSVAEVDRITKNGGFIVLGDFLPDFQHRRHYHHLPGENLYTYKQDYAKIFEALETYKELAKITFNHDHYEEKIQVCQASSRAMCVILQKSLYGFYQEIL